jgi:radical SAM-linked protein
MVLGSDARSPLTPAADSAPPPSPVEPRQRWRVTYARSRVPSERVGRAALEEWEAALIGSGLPIATSGPDGRRPRMSFAAPLPAGAEGERELVDLWLEQRLAAWQLRDALEPRLPPDHSWLDAEDVWLGEPALPGQVVGAEWLVLVSAVDGPSRDFGRDLVAAAARLLERTSIDVTRSKGGIEKKVDLRPLIDAIGIDSVQSAPRDGRRTVLVRLRLRIDPERGSARPDEVVTVLGNAARVDIDIVDLTRVRLILAADVAVPSGATDPQPGRGVRRRR